eukprot:743622-Rhodomonas_salina.1
MGILKSKYVPEEVSTPLPSLDTTFLPRHPLPCVGPHRPSLIRERKRERGGWEAVGPASCACLAVCCGELWRGL